MEEKEIGIYIHIPFCKQKCYYCDFVSFSNCETKVEKYFKSLQEEILQYARENKIMSEHYLEPKYLIKTIYFGGGTPSYVDEKYIINTLKIIKENFKISEKAEITIEVNPGTTNKQKLQEYKNSGINRLSIGLQSSKDSILKSIGRIHTYKQFEETYKDSRDVGFSNINIDLMLNLPNQTLEDIKESIKKIIELKPEHISVYSLIVEKNTKIYDLVNSKQIILAEDEEERKMYWTVKKLLEKHKYHQYEISNFSKSGFESKHNIDCWNQKEYLGFGVNASSFIDDKRYSNISNLDEYIINIEKNNLSKNLILEEMLNDQSKMDEYMILSLRKMEGVNMFEFEQKFKQNPVVKYCAVLEKLNHEGLIEVIENNIRLTNKGIDLANLVWEEFV